MTFPPSFRSPAGSGRRDVALPAPSLARVRSTFSRTWLQLRTAVRTLRVPLARERFDCARLTACIFAALRLPAAICAAFRCRCASVCSARCRLLRPSLPPQTRSCERGYLPPYAAIPSTFSRTWLSRLVGTGELCSFALHPGTFLRTSLRPLLPPRNHGTTEPRNHGTTEPLGRPRLCRPLPKPRHG
jgi:hypothetical protein